MRLQLPAGVSAKRVAGGRKGATRWELYQGPVSFETWIGDIVRWEPEGTWDWQPRGGPVVEARTGQEAVPAIPSPPAQPLI